jgi:hypothetical protein
MCGEDGLRCKNKQSPVQINLHQKRELRQINVARLFSSSINKKNNSKLRKIISTKHAFNMQKAKSASVLSKILYALLMKASTIADK